MKVNLRIGLLLSNHHPEVEDDLALELILSAFREVRDPIPGEVVIAVFTPEDTVWLFTAHHGVWELEKGPEGSWEAVRVPC